MISGCINHELQWAEIDGQRFSMGDEVHWTDDCEETYHGKIDLMLLIKGKVEASLSDTPLGRIPLEELKLKVSR
ncbi:hypothetical protein OAH77_04440 [Flavobacteriaceae bacterium]|nr:hypothetical protein [Flavobacteriaceae bacterium]